jgi:6-phospho-3-hexuloisomerase
MSIIMKRLQVIRDEIDHGISLIQPDDEKEMLDALHRSGRIFLAGSGRSGLAVRAFANRLVHLGKTVHVVGDITTPSIQAGDVLFIGSGSGETSGLILYAQKAKQAGAKVILNTTNPLSTLGKLADHVLVIRTDNKSTDSASMSTSVQPMGTLFEQLSLLLYDAIVLEWMSAYRVDFNAMKARHANLE